MNESLGVYGDVTVMLFDGDGNKKSVSHHHNLILDRGLTYLFQRVFSKLTNYSVVNSAVTYNPTVNPFAYMVVGYSDSGGSPISPIPTESNAQTNNGISTLYAAQDVNSQRVASKLYTYGFYDTFDFSLDFKSGGDTWYPMSIGDSFYDYYAVNTTNATVLSSNITNNGYLTVTTASTDINNTTFTAPFMYTLAEDYIDMETQVIHTPGQYDMSGLCVRDDAAAQQQNVFIANLNNTVVVGTTVNGVTTVSTYSDNHTIFKITRDLTTGYITTYSKANQGDTWTQRDQYTRTDLNVTLQAGIFSATTSATPYTSKFHYFSFLNNGGPAFVDVTCNFVGSSFVNGTTPFTVNTVGLSATTVANGNNQNYQLGSRVNITPVTVLSTDTLSVIYRLKVML